MPDQSLAGETIGQRLKRLRLDRHLSQRELAAPGVSCALQNEGMKAQVGVRMRTGEAPIEYQRQIQFVARFSF